MRHVQTNRDNETECDEEWTRKGQHTFSYCTLSQHAPLHLQSSVHCRFDERHLHWHLQPFLHPQCTRWTLLVFRSKKGFHPGSDVTTHTLSAGSRLRGACGIIIDRGAPSSWICDTWHVVQEKQLGRVEEGRMAVGPINRIIFPTIIMFC